MDERRGSEAASSTLTEDLLIHVDLVILARAMLRDPYWPYHAARKLGVENAAELLPIQYARAAKG